MPQYGRLESRSRHRGPTPCRAIRLFSKIRLRRRWKSIESTSVARHTIPKYLIAIGCVIRNLLVLGQCVNVCRAVSIATLTIVDDVEVLVSDMHFVLHSTYKLLYTLI